MESRLTARLTGRELHPLFDRLFPNRFAGPDVAAEIAPEGWAQSTLLACFHPSVEQVFEEDVLLNRNLQWMRHLGRQRKSNAPVDPRRPKLDDVRREF